MAQTFDIRFAKSAGLAGLFEAPANEYRWKGAGRLSIDAVDAVRARHHAPDPHEQSDWCVSGR